MDKDKDKDAEKLETEATTEAPTSEELSDSDLEKVSGGAFTVF